MSRRFAAISTLFALVVVIGCNNSSTPSKPFQTTSGSPKIELPPSIGTGTETKKDDSAPAKADTSKVDLKVATGDEIEAAIKQHQGKIVVVDIWATWCVPCKKEFPNLVKLHQARAADGVQAISVAWDTADDRGKALGFLTEQKATFPNFLLDRDEDDTKKWMDSKNVKSIPVVLVYDRDGKLAKKFDLDNPDDQFTYEQVNKLVDQLLKK